MPLEGGLPSAAVPSARALREPRADQTRASLYTVAGHPEFNSKIVNEVIEMRESKGVISKEVADESRENANSHDDGQYIGRVILRMFGL